MTQDELLRYYEARVETGNKRLAEAPPNLKHRVDWDNGYWHERAIPNIIRVKAGLPVCSGAVDCVAVPTTKCKGGTHQTCPAHVQSCYLCVTPAT